MTDEKDTTAAAAPGAKSTKEEVALELMKFIAGTTGYGKGFRRRRLRRQSSQDAGRAGGRAAATLRTLPLGRREVGEAPRRRLLRRTKRRLLLLLSALFLGADFFLPAFLGAAFLAAFFTAFFADFLGAAFFSQPSWQRLSFSEPPSSPPFWQRPSFSAQLSWPARPLFSTARQLF